MPDKLTDKEIKKALEWCISKFKNAGFVYLGVDGTKIVRTQEVLDLINRLQAENEQKDRAFENLIEVARLWKEKYNNAKKELFEQKLKNNMLYETAKEIEIKAYKEFAERIKKALYSDSCRLVFDSDLDIFECAIDNFLKELVGEDK